MADDQQLDDQDNDNSSSTDEPAARLAAKDEVDKAQDKNTQEKNWVTEHHTAVIGIIISAAAIFVYIFIFKKQSASQAPASNTSYAAPQGQQGQGYIVSPNTGQGSGSGGGYGAQNNALLQQLLSNTQGINNTGSIQSNSNNGGQGVNQMPIDPIQLTQQQQNELNVGQQFASQLGSAWGNTNILSPQGNNNLPSSNTSNGNTGS